MNEVCTSREINELKVLVYKACMSVSLQIKEHLK